MDELKEKLKIKDIINNDQIFREFDSFYKELGRIQNDIFNKNLDYFKELNQKVSLLVKNLVENIYNMIKEILNKTLNEEKYDSIKMQINFSNYHKFIIIHILLINNIIGQKRI